MKPNDAKITDADWVERRLSEQIREPLELDKGPSSEGDLERLLEWSKKERGVFIHEEFDGRTYFVPDPNIDGWSIDDRIAFRKLDPKTDALILDRDENGDVSRKEFSPSYDPLT